MKINVGNDIIETERIEKIYNKFSDRFINKVFTSKEIEYCEGKGTRKFESYAARFAAKEAVFKAISPNLENKFSVNWKDIEVLNNEDGRPYVTLKNMNITQKIDISLSHIKEYAVATAIAYLAE